MLKTLLATIAAINDWTQNIIDGSLLGLVANE